MSKTYYKIIDDTGWVLSNQYEKSAELVLGYGGVWTKDHRKAKRFANLKQAQIEINKMPCRKGTQFLVVRNNENWKKEYKKWKGQQNGN